ncbi:MAG: GAF domain-containing protein [Cyanobacteria bacterium P01_D01_bin.56]
MKFLLCNNIAYFVLENTFAMSDSRLRRATIFIITAAAAGIIGNSLYDALPDIWNYLKEPQPVSRWLFPAVFAILSIVIPFICIRYLDGREIAATLIGIDAWILRSLDSLYKTQNPSEVISFTKTVCDRIFKKTLAVKRFRKCGIAMYLPDEPKQYLLTWSSDGTPNEISLDLRFNIANTNGQAENHRGVAGKTYLDGETRIVHINSDGLSAKNSPFYFPSPQGRVSYKSFICVAISKDIHEENIGVLCIYSLYDSTFDTKAAVELVEAIAQRLSSVISACYR